ncbi:MAG: ribosome biogenesis GTPase Der [Pseudomonadota bacterium]
MTPIIAIVGRPNVGKSSLFNRLARSRDALVDNQPGITRDRLYASIKWGDIPLMIIDTGGFDDSEHEPLLKQVRGQVIKAIDEADRIIFMVDGLQGPMPGDDEIADLLRKTQKDTYLTANKIDGPERDHLALEFYKIGMPKVYPLSTAHGYGLKALMDDVVHDLPTMEPEEEEKGQIRVAILGRPNVGKSSLINRILGFDRVLVSEWPGTTRDSVDILYQWKGEEYLFIDTAGIRRKGRVKEKIDKLSMIKALRSIDRCHIAIILLDAEAGLADQDSRICGYALERGRALLMAVNKWDLVKKDREKQRVLERAFERQLKFVPFAPRINLSAHTGERVMELMEKVKELFGQFCHRVSTSEVNRAIEEMTRRHPPPNPPRGGLKLYYGTQTGIKPPTFVIFVNRPEAVHFSYQRFIMNQLRERFGLNHIPLRVIYRKR